MLRPRNRAKKTQEELEVMRHQAIVYHPAQVMVEKRHYALMIVPALNWHWSADVTVGVLILAHWLIVLGLMMVVTKLSGWLLLLIMTPYMYVTATEEQYYMLGITSLVWTLILLKKTLLRSKDRKGGETVMGLSVPRYIYNSRATGEVTAMISIIAMISIMVLAAAAAVVALWDHERFQIISGVLLMSFVAIMSFQSKAIGGNSNSWSATILALVIMLVSIGATKEQILDLVRAMVMIWRDNVVDRQIPGAGEHYSTAAPAWWDWAHTGGRFGNTFYIAQHEVR